MYSLYVIPFLFILNPTNPSSVKGLSSLDWPRIAHVIVHRMALETGEKVLVVAHPDKFQDLVSPIRYEVMKAGGIDLGVMNALPASDERESDALQRSSTLSWGAYKAMLLKVDVAIMLPGTNTTPAYAAMQDLLKTGKGRTVHLHWQEDRSVSALAGQSLPVRHDIDQVYQKALLQTDYDALKQILQRFEHAMRDREVHVVTPLGTDLRFRIGDRPVNRQDGDASAARTNRGIILIDREIELPAGVIRVAPLEETVHGTIAFPTSQWNNHPVIGLKLDFIEGRVVDVNAETGRQHVDAEMTQAGEVGHRFREFALGFNPQLAVPKENPWIPYYGYGAGVVRLSLGDNSELGGTVRAEQVYIRWNFFTDATVTVGDQVWVRDGKLLMD